MSEIRKNIDYLTALVAMSLAILILLAVNSGGYSLIDTCAENEADELSSFQDISDQDSNSDEHSDSEGSPYSISFNAINSWSSGLDFSVLALDWLLPTYIGLELWHFKFCGDQNCPTTSNLFEVVFECFISPNAP